MNDIDEVKSRLNIVDIIGQRVKLTKAGRNFKGLCPFHNEKTPSFMVSSERQSFHCFGCGKGGSVIDFVMEYERVDFREALETLAERAGVKLQHRMDSTPEMKLKDAILALNHLAAEFYHFLLTTHAIGEQARAYVGKRGVSDKVVKTFMLGYSPNSWDGLHKYLRKKGYDDELMEQAGLILQSQHSTPHNPRYYDRFRGRLMFALKDHRGNVVGFSGRVLDPDAKEAKYINTSETPVYSKSHVLYGLDVTKQAIQKANEAVLMEGEFDVISAYQAGISNVVAIKGSALTEGHVHLLRRFTERITFALDSDMAGDAASRRGIDIAEKAGLDMKVVIMPMGKDPDDVAREQPALLKQAIKDAISIYDYFFTSAFKRFDPKDPFGKKKISDELIPIIAKIDNPIVQGHYVRRMAEELGVAEDIALEGIRKHRRNLLQPRPRSVTPTEQSPAVERTRTEKMEIYLLSLLLQGKTADLLEDLKDTMPLTDLTVPPVRELVQLVTTYLESQAVFFLKDFADTVPPELAPTLDEACLWDLSGLNENEETYAREWTRTVREIRKLKLKARLQEISSRITEEENDELHQELTRITRELSLLEKSQVL